MVVERKTRILREQLTKQAGMVSGNKLAQTRCSGQIMVDASRGE